MLAVLLYMGAKLVISGDLTVGELVAFNMLAGRVSAPVLRLAQLWQDFHQARLSVARLGDILNTPAEPTYMPGRTVLPSVRGQLLFDHVSFRYRPDQPENIMTSASMCRLGKSSASSDRPGQVRVR